MPIDRVPILWFATRQTWFATRQTATGRSLPTMFDLPDEDPTEPGLPNEFHALQPQLMSATAFLKDVDPDRIFSAIDLNLYYDPDHPTWYKRPDWFLVVGVDRLYHQQHLRLSYVVWDEGVIPTIVVEFLSPGTEAEDLGRFAAKPPVRQPGQPPSKFEVYEQILQIPNYVTYDNLTETIRYFRWIDGQYHEQPVADTNPRIWIPELNLGLGLWEGQFQNSPRRPLRWLRWCDANGEWIATEMETALKSEQLQKEFERSQKESAQQQLRQTVRNLVAMGLPISQIAQAIGMTELEVEAIAQSNE